MDREEHGKARAGKITGTLADTVMYGSAKAWETAITQLWADDGKAFAEATTGARAYGIDHESIGASLFWEQHLEYDIRHEPWVDYHGKEKRFVGLVGVSPDRMLYVDGIRRAGLEIKSPTEERTIVTHLPRNPLDPRSNPHFSQMQHGMLCTGLRRWYLVVHYKGQYFEVPVEYDVEWQLRYQDRLIEFIEQYHGAKPKPRRKLRISDDE